MTGNTKLNHALEPGEVIRWSGIPQPYSLFDESRKTSTIISLCWALAWGVILVGGYYALSLSKDTEIQTGVMVFFAAVPLFIAWMPVSDKNKINKLSYAVTDKKAIIVSKDNDKAIAMRIADIDDIRIEKADNGNCHIRVGSPACKTSSRKLPGFAYRGEFSGEDSNKTCKGLVFFNVSAEDGKAIDNLLKPEVPPTKK